MFRRRNKVDVLELITELVSGEVLIGNRVTDEEWVIDICHTPGGEWDYLYTATSEKECRRFMEQYKLPVVAKSQVQGTSAE